MELELVESNGENKACKFCGTFFNAKRSNAKYCAPKCRAANYRKRLRRKVRLQAVLSFFGLGTKKGATMQAVQEPDQNDPSKVDYARLTFVLSVLGFLGSVGFYFGVLREVYSPVRDKQKIEVLETNNQKLQNTIEILVEELAAHE